MIQKSHPRKNYAGKSSRTSQSHQRQSRGPKTSWEPVQQWYNNAVGRDGLYYHQSLIIPGTLKLLDLTPQSRLLDLACGQGILGRHASVSSINYLGIDAAPSLIADAQKTDRNKQHQYQVGDITLPLTIPSNYFSHAAIILALQNLEQPLGALQNIAKALQPEGVLVLVLNHPCFRIPRQSSWQIDQSQKMQYRRINLYASPLKIPINTNPGQQRSVKTWTFHHSLADLSTLLATAGFVISDITEWVSDKTSIGSAATMENRARLEFPLFMAIKAIKYRPTTT